MSPAFFKCCLPPPTSALVSALLLNTAASSSGLFWNQKGTLVTGFLFPFQPADVHQLLILDLHPSYSHIAGTILLGLHPQFAAKAAFLLPLHFERPSLASTPYFWILCTCEWFLLSNSSELSRKILYSIALHKHKIMFILHQIFWWNQCDPIKAKAWKINPLWNSMANKLLKLRMDESFTTFSKVFNWGLWRDLRQVS